MLWSAFLVKMIQLFKAFEDFMPLLPGVRFSSPRGFPCLLDIPVSVQTCRGVPCAEHVSFTLRSPLASAGVLLFFIATSKELCIFVLPFLPPCFLGPPLQWHCLSWSDDLHLVVISGVLSHCIPWTWASNSSFFPGCQDTTAPGFLHSRPFLLSHLSLC